MQAARKHKDKRPERSGFPLSSKLAYSARTTLWTSARTVGAASVRRVWDAADLRGNKGRPAPNAVNRGSERSGIGAYPMLLFHGPIEVLIELVLLAFRGDVMLNKGISLYKFWDV